MRVSKIDPRMLVNPGLSTSDLERSLLCFSAMAVLTYIRENDYIELTKIGAFNRRFVNWAVDTFLWPGCTRDELLKYNKVLNEKDVQPVHFLHDLLVDARLIRHAGSRAVLTKKGAQHLQNSGRLQVTLFDAFLTIFDFSAHEGFEFNIGDIDYAHCLGVASNRADDWIGVPELTNLCLPVPYLVSQGLTTEEFAMFCIYSRMVRPLLWLGLVETDEPMRYPPVSTIKLRKTKLFDRFLAFDFPDPRSKTRH